MEGESYDIQYDSGGETGRESLLARAFGPHSKTKILAVLVTKSQRDLSVREIAELAGIDRTHAYEPLEDLVRLGLVEPTRKVSNTQLYQINRELETTRIIAELQFTLADELSDRLDDVE